MIVYIVYTKSYDGYIDNSNVHFVSKNKNKAIKTAKDLLIKIYDNILSTAVTYDDMEVKSYSDGTLPIKTDSLAVTANPQTVEEATDNLTVWIAIRPIN